MAGCRVPKRRRTNGSQLSAKSTSDCSFTPEHGYDFQKPYMEMWLRFIGITDVASITVQKTLAGLVIDGDARAEARRKAQALARFFESLSSHPPDET
jgi:FMN-dependent NADH-azoreductase